MFSLDSLQVITAADGGVLCVCDGVVQAPSVRKIVKEVKQRQPCYLTLVIYDRTEEPPVSDKILLSMSQCRVCAAGSHPCGVSASGCIMHRSSILAGLTRCRLQWVECKSA